MYGGWSVEAHRGGLAVRCACRHSRRHQQSRGRPGCFGLFHESLEVVIASGIIIASQAYVAPPPIVHRVLIGETRLQTGVSIITPAGQGCEPRLEALEDSDRRYRSVLGNLVMFDRGDALIGSLRGIPASTFLIIHLPTASSTAPLHRSCPMPTLLLHFAMVLNFRAG